MSDIAIYVSSDLSSTGTIINGERLDLYATENIIMMLKQTDIKDISTNFYDLTQTFQVPASPKNNRILKYWYNPLNSSQVSNIEGLPCRIDIGGVFYRKGTLKILKAQKDANGNIKTYSVAFDANLKSLKDRFGDMQLSNLDYTGLIGSNEFDYNDLIVKEGIVNNTGSFPIKYPLISTTRLFEDFNDVKYVDSGTLNGIRFDEIRPALNFKSIFNAIEKTFDMRFVGNYFSDTTKLDRLYLWLNKNEFPIVNTLKVIDISGTPSSLTGTSYNTTYDYYTIERYSFLVLIYRLVISITVSNSSTPYKIFLQELVLNNDGSVNELATEKQDNGGIVASSSDWRKGNSNISHLIKVQNMPVGTKKSFRLLLENRGAINVTACKVQIFRTIGSGGLVTDSSQLNSTAVTEFTSKFNIAKSIPDMSVYDFFMSTMKMFNIVCIPVYDVQIQSLLQSDDVFRLELFTEYYGSQGEFDITKYTKRGETLNKIKNYKKYEFKHDESEFGLNKTFVVSQNPAREYGSFKEEFSVGDDGELKVESKFGLLIWNELLNVDITTDYELNNTWITSNSLDDSFEKSVFNKPTIFFYNGESTIPSGKYLAYTAANDTSSTLTRYSIFSNIDNLDFGEYKTTLTFSEEYFFNSSRLQKSLYYNYYKDMVYGIFSSNLREYEVEAKLPRSIYTKISLGSTLIIQNMRFNITDISINLLDGVTKLKLNNVIELTDIPELP